MILQHVLDGGELSAEQALVLLRDADLGALKRAADTLRRRQVGDSVTYVVNRNINFTNVCAKTCHFCAFARGRRSEQGYLLPVSEIVRRAVEAHAHGATEVCLQAGLAPVVGGRDYVRLVRAVKEAVPALHLHAFSPAEIVWGARRGGSVRELLKALRDEGLGSLPGTSAEVLDDDVRKKLSPGRISTASWLEVIRCAHELEIPTTSTLMFGHLESLEDQVAHMGLLRRVQRDTGGFSEFVPLSFIHDEAPLFAKAPGVRPGPTHRELRALYAVARLFLGRDIPNLQASWVKQGLPVATELLGWGCNDLGGTLMNESISTSAGAAHGQLMSPSVLRAAVRSIGRAPQERTTLYAPVSGSEVHPLDGVDGAAFGSYAELSGSDAFRYRQSVEELVAAPVEELEALRL